MVWEMSISTSAMLFGNAQSSSKGCLSSICVSGASTSFSYVSTSCDDPGAPGGGRTNALAVDAKSNVANPKPRMMADGVG